MFRDYTKLHIVVILWGFTAILGKLIDLDSPVLVFYRVGASALILAIMIRLLKIKTADNRSSQFKMIANGILLGTHWTLFFLAVKIANVSVCMIGMATTSLWTAILEPLIIKNRSFRRYEFGLGAIMIAAIILITGGDFNYYLGLMIAIISAGIGTLFSIINSQFTKNHHHYAIAYYQMLGATAIAGLTIIGVSLWRDSLPQMSLNLGDFGWLMLLVCFCTVYAYAQYIELLKRLSVFTIHLAYNLEPVYGMIFAAFFFKEHHLFGPLFYFGAAIIFISVIIHPFFEKTAKQSL
ncbi:MAG: DMT family transporter [Verrucomicrobiota bacterium]|nr:DMT family transporter [Verrucomicrobiota bacterium]